MTRTSMMERKLKEYNLTQLLEKHGLVPQFETWVSISITDPSHPDPYPDCGIRFYIKNTKECVGMLHLGNNSLRDHILVSKMVNTAGGINRLGKYPHQMENCYRSPEEFDEKVSKLLIARSKQKAASGQMKLFKVTLGQVEYDTYDSAIIACSDQATLQKLIDDGKFNNDRHRTRCNLSDYYVDSVDLVEYEQSFKIKSQRVESITYIGNYCGDIREGRIAKVVCSSFNAG